MKYSLYMGKILGVKVYIHWTFSLLILWIITTSIHGGLSFNTFLWMFGLTMAVFACIVVHELGHAVVAKRFEISTKHITLLPIGGIAQLETIPEKPKQELLIALAGPAVNIGIALILLPLIDVRTLTQPESLVTNTSNNFVFSLMVVNVWLGIFNLIPAFPMDGGRILRATLAFWMDHAKATKVAAGIGQVFGTVFFVAGFIYSPTLIFIGIFIFLGGQYEFALADTLRLLKGYTVDDVLMKEVPTMDKGITLKDAGDVLLNTQNKHFVVVDNGRPVGTIHRDEILKALDGDKNTLLENVKNNNLSFVKGSMALDEAWKMLRQPNTPLLLVGSNDLLDGIVDQENVGEFILLKSGRKLRN